MKQTFLKIGLGLLALAGAVGSLQAAAPLTKTLSGHVPPAVAKLTAVGQLPADTNLSLSIGLPLHNRAAAEQLLQDMYDPANAGYHQYLSPEEFTAKFGPTEEEYQAVINFAATNGLTVTQTHPNRMLVSVSGKVANIENAFHVKMMQYHHPSEARDFYAPSAEPSVDASLPVLAVQGMNNFVQPHAMLKKRPATLRQPSVGSGPGGGLIGNDFRNAYLPGSSLNGSGQIVGLLQFDGYYPSDIQTYAALAGLTNVPLQNVLLDGFNGAPGFNNDEVCLDIEMSMAMAPALSKIVVFEAGPFGNPNDILSSMASSNTIKQLSSSWGYTIDATTRQLYLQLALQGQTYLNCSGDGDAWLNGTYIQGTLLGSVEDSFVTVVGGTTLTMNGVGASYASESAWNWGAVGGFSWNPDGYVGTSGGISTDVLIPSWQTNIIMTTNHGSATFRNVPDVALTADNIFVVSSGGSQGIFGGTSAATPLWAGFMALINQQAVANGKPTIGFLAPTVYALAKTTNYATCFHDVVLGDNTWDQSLTNFFAVAGYDLCTGLGTPNGTNLINALTGTNSVPVVYTPIIPAPKQPWGNTLSPNNGKNPNGLWLLYIQDDTAPYGGTNYNGWMLNLTTANPVGFASDNQLYINATNVSLTPGSQWTTVLAVTNYGPSISTNVIVTDKLPDISSVTLLSSSTTLAGSTITQYGDTLVWNANNLPVNAGGTLTLTFTAAYTGIYTNSATVDSTTTDPNSDDNSVGLIANIAYSTPPVLLPNFKLSGSGGFQLSVTNDIGGTIVIQASTNLTSWLPIYTNVAPFTFTNFDTTNFSKRFYRAVTQ